MKKPKLLVLLVICSFALSVIFMEKFALANDPPNTPATPSGPSSGFTGTDYNFSTSASDPDGDSLEYRYDWGDGEISSWGSPTRSHS